MMYLSVKGFTVCFELGWCGVVVVCTDGKDDVLYLCIMKSW